MADSPASPQKFGRFAISRKIGQGGFGDVWLAEDTLLKRQVALKLPRFAPSDTKRQRRFLAESRTAALLRHPHIVPVLDAGEIDGKHFIASEFIRGVPLDEIHEDRPASVHWAVEVVAKLARATEVAHQQQIIHRDLKPDNVLIDRRGEPQILDFGLAKRLDDEQAQTMDGTVMGTPHFMSPEQARGAVSKIGPASDQFSLGVILYRLLAGNTPHTGQPLAVLRKLIDNPNPSLANVERGVPADLVAICDKARAADIDDRYPSCEALAEDLERFLAGLPVAARPPSPLTRAGRWVRSHPREAGLAAASVASGLLLFTISIWGWAQAAQAAEQAAISEQGVRDETARLVGLEERLTKRVAEAAALRDETAAARQATIAAREALEAESETLDQQTQLAEASLAKLREAETGLSNAEAQRQQVEASLSNVVRAIDVMHLPQLLCTTGQEAFVFKPAGKLQLELTNQENQEHFSTMIFSGNKQQYGVRYFQIHKKDSNKKWSSPLVPFVTGKKIIDEADKEISKMTRPEYLRALEQGAVPNTRINNKAVAVDKENRIYFVVEWDKHRDVLRYDPEIGDFKFIVQLPSKVADMQFYADDPSALHILIDGSVKRYDMTSNLNAAAETVFVVNKSVFGNPSQAIRISEKNWLVCFQEQVDRDKNLWISRLVLIDLESKTYRIAEISAEARSRWAIAPSGVWVNVYYGFFSVYALKEEQ